MDKSQEKRREKFVKGMKKNKEDLKARYGDKWKEVMYATATKNAVKEELTESDEMDVKTALKKANIKFSVSKKDNKLLVKVDQNDREDASGVLMTLPKFKLGKIRLAEEVELTEGLVYRNQQGQAVSIPIKKVGENEYKDKRTDTWIYKVKGNQVWRYGNNKYSQGINIGQLKSITEAVEYSLNEDISQPQLNDLEKFADRLMAKFNIDVEFTRHFADRANDKRNTPDIKLAELQKLFKKIAKDKARQVLKYKNAEAVLKDIQTDLNLPFVLKPRGGELELVMKTIMRKKNFKTSNPEVKYESESDIHNGENVNEDMNAFVKSISPLIWTKNYRAALNDFKKEWAKTGNSENTKANLAAKIAKRYVNVDSRKLQAMIESVEYMPEKSFRSFLNEAKKEPKGKKEKLKDEGKTKIEVNPEIE